MKLVGALLGLLAGLAVYFKFVEHWIDRLNRADAPYWQRLTAVYVAVLMLIVGIFVLPAMGMAVLGVEEIKLNSWSRAVAPDEAAGNAFILGNYLALGAVGIRVVHDMIFPRHNRGEEPR